MSLTERSAAAALLPGRPTTSTLRAARVSVYTVCTLLAIATNYLCGKEMAWDLLNYHLYAGFSAVNNRFAQDYFGAGPVAYLNPYAYVPFYAMVVSGLPAIAIGSLLAAAQSIVLWLTFELAICVSDSDVPGTRLTYGVLAVVLAFMNPILIQQIGSSFADITTAALVLGGWLLLTTAMRIASLTRVAGAAALLGVATALKLTNAVHAVAALTILVMLPLPLRSRIRYGAYFVLLLGLSFLVISAPWSYRLEGTFGNPFFPLVNNIFHSPEFTTEPLRHSRFIPGTLVEALWRPFKMLDPVSMVQEEVRAPDLRYAALIVLLGVLLMRRALRGLAPPAPAAPAGSSGHVSSGRALAALACGLGVDWALWLSQSGNGRYFLPMACVAAVVIVALLPRLLPTQPGVRAFILAIVIGIQALQLWMGTDFRWNPAPWGGAWFKVAAPETLRTEANLFLTIGVESKSFLAPYFADSSGWVNFSGGYALGPDGPGGARVAALINRFSPHLRVLVDGKRLYSDTERRPPLRSQVDAKLARFGLRVDTDDCATITVHDLPPPLEIVVSRSAPIEPQSRDTTYLVTCHVVPDLTEHAADLTRKRAADLVLDRLEDACPDLFRPRRLLSEPEGEGWQRIYMDTDLIAWVSHGWLKFRNPMRSDNMVNLGRESDWAAAPPPLACGRNDGHYFIQVLESERRP
jgi:hypothetical protein